jgi:hypothetical protein
LLLLVFFCPPSKAGKGAHYAPSPIPMAELLRFWNDTRLAPNKKLVEE